MSPTPYSSVVFTLNSHLSLSRSLGMRHITYGVLISNAWSGAKACEYTIVYFSKFEAKHQGHNCSIKRYFKHYIKSSPLPILDPHATGVPSNILEKNSIGSCVANGVHNLVTNSSMVKLMGFPTSDSTFTYQKGVKSTSLVDLLLNKVLWIAIISTKSLIHFQRWCLVKELPSPPELP